LVIVSFWKVYVPFSHEERKEIRTKQKDTKKEFEHDKR